MSTPITTVELSPAFAATRDHVRGTSGPVLLMFGDYECPYSRMANGSIQRLRRELDEGFRCVFRHLALTAKHPHALAAAEAAEAAAAQGRFWAMHDSLFAHQRALEPTDLESYARELTLDVAAFENDLDRHAHFPRIREDLQSARDSGAHGTPTLFLDGARYSGSYAPDEFGPVLEEAIRG